MKFHLFALLVALFFSSLLLGRTAESARTVILLSFDGTRTDALTQENAPHFLALEKEGWHGSITPIFPSETFPNHTAMLTGATAQDHGIVSNKFLDAERGPFTFEMDPSWIGAEPLWVILEKKEIPTAIILWPLYGLGSWKGWHPTYETKLSKKDLIHEIIHTDDQKKFDTILSLLQLSEKKRPRFIASWFVEIDTQGHATGSGSPQVNKAISRYDMLLAEFLKKFYQLPQSKNCDLIIVSDHGMAKVRTGLSVPYLEQQLNQFGSVKIIQSGPNARLYCSPSVVASLYPFLKKLGDHTHAFDVYRGNQLPEAWHDRHPRNGEIVLTAHPNYYFVPKASSTELVIPVTRPTGAHGYPTSLRSMQALFIAAGPDFQARKEPVHFQMTQIAPLILKILGIKLQLPMQSKQEEIDHKEHKAAKAATKNTN